MLSAYTWRHRASGKMGIGICQFLKIFLHNKFCLNEKYFGKEHLGIIIAQWAISVTISAFLLFFISAVVCGE